MQYDVGLGNFDFSIPGGGAEGIFSGVSAPTAPEALNYTPIGQDVYQNAQQPFYPAATQVIPGAPTSPPPPPDQGIAGLAKSVLPFIQGGVALTGAGLGIEQLGIAKKGQEAQLRALKTEQQAAKPAAAAAGQLIPAGTSAVLGGTLPPGLEAEAQTYEQNLRAQVRQMAAHLQIPEGTAMAQMESMIAQQVAVYRQQLAQSVLTAGTGVANTAIQGGAVSGSQGRAIGGDITQSLTDANAALSKMLAAA